MPGDNLREGVVVSQQGGLFGEKHQALYSPYYRAHSDNFRKREISANQSLSYMRRFLNPGMFSRLLDVGAGEGSLLSLLSNAGFAGELHAVEVSESGIESIKTRQISALREVQLFDGYHIPYPDKHFDLAISIHVLEHVEHERLFLRELRRVARRVWVEVPLESGLRIRRAIERGKKYGHINFYTPETLKSLLESVGLNVVHCRAVGPSAEYEQHLSGRYKGWIKSAVRGAALKIAPQLAPRFLVYNGIADCDCE